MRAYQTSRSRWAAKPRMAARYRPTVDIAIERHSLSVNPRSRPAITVLAARRFTSHSHGPGRVSSKSLIEKTTLRSGEAKPPKLPRWASPQSCTSMPDRGPGARSAAMMAAPPRKKANGEVSMRA